MPNTIPTSMCIQPTLNWFGRSAGPVAVYCAATLAVLGITDGTVERDPDGSCLLLTFGGVVFRAVRQLTPSQWFVLEAVCS